MYHFPVVVESKYDLSGIYPPMQKYVNKIIECMPIYIDKLIIFGSAVTLRYGEESDLDIVVITDEEQKDVLMDMSKCLRGIGVSVDLIIKTVEQFDREKNDINTICSEADRKGVCIYERSLYTG